MLERFAGGTVLNPVFVIAAKAFGALDHGDDGTQKPDDEGNGGTADGIIGQQRNGSGNDQLKKLHPLISILRLLRLLIVPHDLVIQTVLDIAFDVAGLDFPGKIRRLF